MNDDGYTLAETLAALVMIGLAVAGLVAGLDQLGRIQGRAGAKASHADVEGRLNASLDHLLNNAGPFRSDDAKALNGDGQHFSFACGEKSCGAELARKNGVMNFVLIGQDEMTHALPIGSDGAFTFTYDDDRGEENDWPPSGEHEPQTLRAIAIVKPKFGENLPIAVARIFNEQPATCAFDAISRTCRPEAAQ